MPRRETLSRFLSSRVDELATDGSSRLDILQRMATDATIETSEIDSIMAGRTLLPSPDTLRSFANTLDVPNDDLLTLARSDAEAYGTESTQRGHTATAPNLYTRAFEVTSDHNTETDDMSWTINTDGIDSYGTIIRAEGADFSYYKKYNHVRYFHGDLVLGGSSISRDGSNITALMTPGDWDTDHDEVMHIKRKALKGWIRGASVGIEPNWKEFEYDEALEAWVFNEWQLVEWSLVPSPSNSDASISRNRSVIRHAEKLTGRYQDPVLEAVSKLGMDIEEFKTEIRSLSPSAPVAQPEPSVRTINPKEVERIVKEALETALGQR